jgi:hypothetical protein
MGQIDGSNPYFLTDVRFIHRKPPVASRTKMLFCCFLQTKLPRDSWARGWNDIEKTKTTRSDLGFGA